MIRIGIVDDEESARRQISDAIGRFAAEKNVELEVRSFSSAGAYLAEKDNLFDILYLDIDMPGMSGMEPATTIRQTDSSIVIIFCTNLQQFAVNGYEVGALGFLVKPMEWYPFQLYLERALKGVAGAGYAALGGGALPGAGGGSGAATGGEAPTMTLADNEFADMSIEDLDAISRADWEAKEANGEVAYFFEGQYTEGFATVVDPACLDMYLCTDGSMYGSLSGPTTSVAPGVTYVYGYWYNLDEAGEEDFVIHLSGTQNLDGTTRATNPDGGEDADIHVFDTEHGDYSWEASFSLGLYGGAMTRNMNIYGQQYAPVQSLTIDASAMPTFYTGDSLDVTTPAVTAVRGSGSTETIWPGRVSYSGFDSESTGTKTVTTSFLGVTATFDVNVEELVTDTYTGTYGLIVDGEVTDTDATLLVDHSHMTLTVSNADGSVVETGTIVEDGDDALTSTMNGSEQIEVTIADGKLTIPAHTEVVYGMMGNTSYEVGEYSFTLQ